MSVARYVNHSIKVLSIASEFGWLPGARYTNLRDVRHVDRLGLLDVDWRGYAFDRHLAATRRLRPAVTIAKDVECIWELDGVLSQAYELSKHAKKVVVVPKDPLMKGRLDELIPADFVLGYSVPSRYGGTQIPPQDFRRPVHLLGGRPDLQRRLANEMPVHSLDCNRFTLDAAFGDFFDGETFRPHPAGGYERCLRASLANINALWEDYESTV